MSSTKKLLCVLFLMLALCACAPAPAEEAVPAPEPAPQETAVCYLGDSTSSLSRYIARHMETWAEQEGWVFLAYDCKGRAATQSIQVGDLTRLGKGGVAVVWSALSQEELDEAAEKLCAAQFQVITLGAAPSAETVRYVRYRLTVDADAALQTAIEVMEQAVENPQAEYLCLSSFWPEPREDVLREGLPEGWQRSDVQYTGGKASFGREYTLQSLEEHPDLDLVFAFATDAALGASQALQEANRWTEVSVFTALGEQEAVEAVEGGRLRGAVAVSPAETWKLLQGAVKKALQGTGAGEISLTLHPVTEENAGTLAEEYKH